MSKLIEIIVSSTGETQLETKGFVGEACREASQFLEAALGAKTSERQTAECYGSVTSTTVQARPGA